MDIHEQLVKSSSVPLGIISRIINANVIRHDFHDRYELDLSVFFKHYRVYLTDEELKNSKNQSNLIRDKWIQCVSQFHEDIAFIIKRDKDREKEKR